MTNESNLNRYNHPTNPRHPARLFPADIIKATGCSSDDAFAMIANLLKSDFDASCIGDWMNNEDPSMSYFEYVEAVAEMQAEFMVEDRAEMFSVEAHQSMAATLTEWGKLLKAASD